MPIFDKAQEFISFFIEQMEDIWKAKLPDTPAHFCGLYTTTRNHLVYSARNWYNLYTPIGLLDFPNHKYFDISQTKELHRRLTEKFGMIELLPEHIDEHGNTVDAVYCVPLDPKQPPEFPPLLRSQENRARHDAVFRTREIDLLSNYCKLNGIDHIGIRESGDPRAKKICREFDKWKDEVSLVDDTIPFTMETAKKLQYEIIDYFYEKHGYPEF